jgi:3-isopropylmalate/(R)-2-methylmalate dehydratase large subunit
MSGQTLTQKILAHAASVARAEVGEILNPRVDLAMMHDSGGPRRVDSKLRDVGAQVWDPERVVVVSDHYVPAVDADSAQILAFTRGWVAERGIKHFYDMRGICHVVLPEHGHLKPGMFVVGGDSHSPTGGAFGCVMVGIGATEMAGVLITGELWVRVPATIAVALNGAFGTGVVAKDVLLHLCATLGLNNDYRVIEYLGATVANLPIEERMTLCNMAAELGAKTGIIAADQVTLDYLASVAPHWHQEAGRWVGDADAVVENGSKSMYPASPRRSPRPTRQRTRGRLQRLSACGSIRPISVRVPAPKSTICGWRRGY